MDVEKKKILIIVKTAPYIIRSGREVICTAGIDLDTGKWLRVYPIQFRKLPFNKRYDKFQFIEAKVKFDRSDIGQRPDSYKIDQDSIKLLSKLNTTKDWNKINKLFFPTASQSLEDLYKKKEKTGESLGAFKPKEVKSLKIKQVKKEDWKKRQKVNQMGLFFPNVAPLNLPPCEFIYDFICDDVKCKGHRMNFITWEIIETARKWIKIYGDQWQKKIHQKFLDYYFRQRDTWFIVGTHARSGNFMLIGYYSPYRSIIQEVLFKD